MTPSSPKGPCRTGNTTAPAAGRRRGGPAPCRDPGAGGRRARAGRDVAVVGQDPPASTHRLSWVTPMTRHREAGVERRRDDPPRRDARDLVLGRRAAVDHRQHSRIRHRPRLYNRPRGRCVRFSTSELAAHLGGNRSARTSPSQGQHRLEDDPAGQLYVPIVAERDGHDFIGAALDAGRRLPHLARTGGRHGHRGRRHRAALLTPRRCWPGGA